MSHIREAFDSVCEGATKAGCWYVTLIESWQCCGGPEEGGWWFTRRKLVAFKEYPSESLAEAAALAVAELAKELRRAALAAHGEYCLSTMDWLNARGLDADFLPDPDGASEYGVLVCGELPTFDNRKPVYC